MRKNIGDDGYLLRKVYLPLTVRSIDAIALRPYDVAYRLLRMSANALMSPVRRAVNMRLRDQMRKP